jgi:hypothetical protein
MLFYSKWGQRGIWEAMHSKFCHTQNVRELHWCFSAPSGIDAAVSPQADTVGTVIRAVSPRRVHNGLLDDVACQVGTLSNQKAMPLNVLPFPDCCIPTWVNVTIRLLSTPEYASYLGGPSSQPFLMEYAEIPASIRFHLHH